MKILYHAMGLFAAFCLMLAVLITSVEATVYWRNGYFEKEYRKYQVLERVPIRMDRLLYVTDEMMEYLKGEREDLTITTNIDGAEREFFNEKEKRHMADVRKLFLGAIEIRRGAVGFAALAAAFLFWKRQSLVLFGMLRWAIGLLLGGIVGLALLAAMDFTKYFTYFHLLFFNNNDWMLDPDTDLLINIVPEGFFRDTAVSIAALFLAVSFLLWLGAGLLRKKRIK